MAEIEAAVEVAVPVRTAYDQWTQFESFPAFMEGVDAVRQLNDTTLEWHVTVAGVARSWRARITEQVPDERIAWASLEGARNDGAVRFEPLGPARTRVTLHLDVEPQGPLEDIGTALGLVEGQVKGDLERFRAFIERRGAETGAWRGDIHDEQETRPDDAG